ncbi:hypothetical protein PRZ48_010393 [Zasmidium cellare]|uniref:Peptidase S8/S53 domain-containing protein n=1 Tax=Zasmidium cellare TaxID=395010 RepID=A0ABR0E936_ZASCE|nr:hypothetical protein PRZ48_010393 [Zasmidium cellare]
MLFSRSLAPFTVLIGFGSTSYLAAFNQSNEDNVIPDRYIVHFHANHTLDDHFAFIRRNLTAEDDKFDHMEFLPGYCTLLNNDTLHNFVRTDPGVKLVEHDSWGYITPLPGNATKVSKRQYVPVVFNGRVAAAYLYGTAFVANIINVKAVPADGRQANSVYARAVNDVMTEHNAKLAANNICFRGSVINMSFGSRSYSAAFHAVVARAMAAGIVLVASAGESSAEMEVQDYPCSYGSVICVGSTDNTYNLAPFSNYGNPPVRIYAPGENIATVGWENDNQILTEATLSGSGESLNSGTSFAAPHIAGLAATFMSWSYLPTRPLHVWYLLVQNAIRGNIPLVGAGSLFGTSGIDHPLKAPYQPFYGGPQNPNFQPRPSPVENSVSENADNSTQSPVDNNAVSCPGWPPYELTHFGSSGSSPLIGERMGSGNDGGGPWDEHRLWNRPCDVVRSSFDYVCDDITLHIERHYDILLRHSWLSAVQHDFVRDINLDLGYDRNFVGPLSFRYGRVAVRYLPEGHGGMFSSFDATATLGPTRATTALGMTSTRAEGAVRQRGRDVLDFVVPRPEGR